MIRVLRAAIVAALAAAGMTAGIGTAVAVDPHAYTIAEQCPCGQDEVDSGLCADHLDPPNEICGSCSNRHMQPYPTGRCPTP